jgi:hypothetical protein
MIRDRILATELAEPAIGKVYLNLSAKPSLGADRKYLADKQHPDHQHRVNRGPAGEPSHPCELALRGQRISSPMEGGIVGAVYEDDHGRRSRKGRFAYCQICDQVFRIFLGGAALKWITRAEPPQRLLP